MSTLLVTKPIIDKILDWLRGNDYATSLIFLVIVAFVLGTLLHMFLDEP